MAQIDLSSQCLKYIENKAFDGLYNLKEIDISNNKLSDLNDYIFSQWKYLDQVAFHQNPLNTISLSAFHPVAIIDKMKTPTAECVCLTNVKICVSFDKTSFSCFGILRSDFHRVHIACLALHCMIFNFVAVFRQILKKQGANRIILILLALADLCSGLHLAIIVAKDFDMKYFRKYIINEMLWRSSYICTTAKCLTAISFIMSNCLQVLKAAQLFQAIRNPFRFHQHNPQPGWYLTSFFLLVGVIILSAILSSFFTKIRNNMCVLYTSCEEEKNYQVYIVAIAFIILICGSRQ